MLVLLSSTCLNISSGLESVPTAEDISNERRRVYKYNKKWYKAYGLMAAEALKAREAHILLAS